MKSKKILTIWYRWTLLLTASAIVYFGIRTGWTFQSYENFIGSTRRPLIDTSVLLLLFSLCMNSINNIRLMNMKFKNFKEKIIGSVQSSLIIGSFIGIFAIFVGSYLDSLIFSLGTMSLCFFCLLVLSVYGEYWKDIRKFFNVGLWTQIRIFFLAEDVQ